MIDLKNKVILITGSSQGIGKTIAIKLASLGAIIALNDIKGQEDNLIAVKNEIETNGGKAEYFIADVSRIDETNLMAEEIEKKLKKVDILVNNAGICRDKTFAKMTPEDWKIVIDINLTGMFNCTKSVLPSIVLNKGSIVNISSIVGQRGNFGQTNYSASKAGMIGFTKSLSKEVGKLGVRVNAIAPGFIETDMTAILKEEIKQIMLSQIPLNRVGTPEDIAKAAAFFASDDAAYITGQVLAVDGGMTMC